ncbi:MAG: hypothetical protein ACLP0H_06140 [Terriglobales bacterium]
MRRMFWKISAIAVVISSAVYGQSLGDIARENRDKQAAEDASSLSTAKPKVITNKDLPKDPNANPGPSATSAAPSGASTVANHKTVESRAAEHQAAERQFAEQRLAEERAAEQWERRILAQRTKVAAMQARVDQLHAALRYESGSAQSEGPYNSRQLHQVVQIQQQLNEQKRKLDQMQEAARHAGMHTAVYDP